MNYKEDYKALKIQYNDTSSLMYKKLRIVDSFIQKGESFLDIGVGTGELINLEKNKFKKIYGFDIDQDSIDICKNRFKNDDHIRIQLGDLKDIDIITKGKKFDYITGLDVLEHVSLAKCINSLNKIYKRLNIGGYFIFTGPGVFEKFRIKIGKSHHIHSHSSYHWAKMFKNSGFKIKTVESVEFPLLNKNEFLRKNLHLFGKCCLIVCEK